MEPAPHDTAPDASPIPVDGLNTLHDETAPAVSPAGDFLYFASDRAGTLDYDGFRRRADGSEPAERLFTREQFNFVRAVSAGEIRSRKTGSRIKDDRS